MCIVCSSRGISSFEPKGEKNQKKKKRPRKKKKKEKKLSKAGREGTWRAPRRLEMAFPGLRGKFEALSGPGGDGRFIVNLGKGNRRNNSVLLLFRFCSVARLGLTFPETLLPPCPCPRRAEARCSRGPPPHPSRRDPKTAGLTPKTLQRSPKSPEGPRNLTAAPRGGKRRRGVRAEISFRRPPSYKSIDSS